MENKLFKGKAQTWAFIFISMLMSYCEQPVIEPEETSFISEQSETELTPQAEKAIYIPLEFRDEGFDSNNSTWSYQRSQQSENFIVFWGAQYGDNNPGDDAVPATYRVNIDDLLAKAESFYDMNVGQLKFAEEGSSKIDTYKMMIFLSYQDAWLAAGAGYDNTIGALWISPNTTQPAGSVIAHEIGHSFQYQVHSDLGGDHGFRYGFGSNGSGGNGFWEQTAQWQAFQSYPGEAFGHNLSTYLANRHRHICHEIQRYDSYWIHYYWADKHGQDIVGKIWREALRPEDPMEAYMRITGINTDQLNAEVYDAATKFITWDIDAIRSNGANYISTTNFNHTELADGSYQVNYDRCPGTTGYNVIKLNVPDAGTVVSTNFTGMVNASGYNQVADPNRAGWRYGFVAMKSDGTRVYGNMGQGTNGTNSFTVPDDCDHLWFVVTGAPSTYAPHPWDNDLSNDDQWPYKVKFTNTELFGKFPIDGTETPQNITFTYDVSFPYDGSNYSGKLVSLGNDLIDLGKAFVLQASEISEKIESEISFYAVESSGNLNDNTTANGYGHWFNASGNVTNWGNNNKVFSEFDENAFTFNIGQHPGQTAPGDQYTISQALVYEYDDGESVQATFVFNVTIE